jgi:hypothetical protein
MLLIPPSGWACGPRLPAPRSEGLTLMPRPHEQRPSKLRNAASLPGDDAEVYCGGWSRERLIAMDARYCEVMRAALSKDAIWSPEPDRPERPR